MAIKRDWDNLGDKLIYLGDLIEELYAREVSNNCIRGDLTDKSREELCEAVIEMLEEVKVGW